MFYDAEGKINQSELHLKRPN